MSQSFAGKVALVTGGNVGIGQATAILFAQAGARVVIAARRVAEGEHTVEAIRQAGGGDPDAGVDIEAGVLSLPRAAGGDVTEPIESLEEEVGCVGRHAVLSSTSTRPSARRRRRSWAPARSHRGHR